MRIFVNNLKKSEFLSKTSYNLHPRSITILASLTRGAAEEVRVVGAGWSRKAFATILAAAIVIR